MKTSWILLGVSAALSAVVLVVTNLITHEPAPEIVAWIFSGPGPLAGFFALFGLPSLLLALYSFLRILHKVRRGVFGGRLSLILTLILAAMAVVPMLITYQSSSAAILRNIDSWFNVQLDDVFDESLEVAQRQIERSLDELEDQAREISRQYNAFEQRSLSAIALDYGLEDIEIISGQNLGGGQLAGDSLSASAGSLLDASPVANRRLVKRFYEGYLLEVAVPIETGRPGLTQSVLRVSAQMPIWLDRSVENLSKGKEELNRIKSLRRWLKTIFIWSLSLSASAVLFVSVSLAAMIGEALSRPLSDLAKAHEAVARGDFSQRPVARVRGEMATLMNSFERMREQLGQARQLAQSNQAKLEESNFYLETLLSNLSAGVVVFGADGVVTKANASACKLLSARPEDLGGKTVDEWGEGNEILLRFSSQVRNCIGAARRESSGESGQEEIKAGDRRLVVNARRMPPAAGGGLVLIIDDITEQLVASEEQAWRAAAQRFAHEIKNPLTPIRLAAERIENKLASKLGEEDAGAMSRYVQTIVGQVDAMREMVDSFRLKRSLADSLEPIRLNEILSESLDLYRYRGGNIHRNFAPEDLVILGSPRLIRQLVVNLVNNSIEAAPEGREAVIDIRTESKHNHASIAVQDNCGGIPDEILAKAFETQMTTKSKGTGLGLPIIRRIVEQMDGRIQIANAGGGLLTTIEIPLHDA